MRYCIQAFLRIQQVQESCLVNQLHIFIYLYPLMHRSQAGPEHQADD